MRAKKTDAPSGIALRQHTHTWPHINCADPMKSSHAFCWYFAQDWPTRPCRNLSSYSCTNISAWHGTVGYTLDRRTHIHADSDLSLGPSSPMCARAGEEGDLRLVGGEVTDDSGFGVVQIFHAGAWGTLCNGDDSRYDYFEGSQYAGINTFDEVRASATSPASCAW